MGNYHFGNYICQLREKKGLSQSQLGEMLGVTNKAVSRWENGGAYPSTELMLPLAKALGVSIEELYQAVSESRAPKTKIRTLLEFLAQHSRIVTFVCTLLSAVPYLLFVFLSDMPDKITLLILTPIMCGMIYGMYRLALFFSRKNPLIPQSTIDIVSVIFMCVMMFGYVSVLPYYFSVFPHSFSPSICFPTFGFLSVVHANKKWMRM